jgi:hypothetical protein
MKHHFYRSSFLRVAAALSIVLTLSLTTASPALALDLNPTDYFQLTFDPVTFDKSNAAAGEVFHITIKGRAACFKDLPLPISEVSITSQVVARPAAGGPALVLNPQYIISIKPLPNKAGQTFDINQTVTLQFPAGAAPGNYSVIGQLTEAKVKVIIWIDVTGSFPQEENMVAVKCIVRSPASTPTTAPPPVAATQATPAAPVFGTTALLTITVIVLVIAVVVLLVVLLVVLRRRGI